MSEARWSRLLWLGLVVAFSPVLLHLALNLRDHPSQRYTLLAPLLIALLLQRDPASRCTRRFGAGVALLAVGLAAQSVGIAASSWSIARTGLPLGVLGITLLTGRPAVAVMALAFAAVPMPSFVRDLGSPRIESLLGSGAVELLSWFGVTIDAGGPLLAYRGEHLELVPSDNGVVTASALAALGWYRSVRAGRSATAAAVGALTWTGSVIVVQPLVVVLAVSTLALGAPGLGRFLLTHGPWLGLAVIALAAPVAHTAGSAAFGRRSAKGGPDGAE